MSPGLHWQGWKEVTPSEPGCSYPPRRPTAECHGRDTHPPAWHERGVHMNINIYMSYAFGTHTAHMSGWVRGLDFKRARLESIRELNYIDFQPTVKVFRTFFVQFRIGPAWCGSKKRSHRVKGCVVRVCVPTIRCATNGPQGHLERPSLDVISPARPVKLLNQITVEGHAP